MPANMDYNDQYKEGNGFEVFHDEVKHEILKLLEATERKGEAINVYNLLLSIIERPLLEATMEYTGNNQLKSAELLGLNRNIFRKKLAFYGMLSNNYV